MLSNNVSTDQDLKKTMKTAGEIQNKLNKDTTKYDALEIGHAMAEDIEKHLYESVNLYKNRIEEKEFCVVMVLAKDPLLKNVVRRKFYCWPFLPKPRPNQAVFLYNKNVDRIVKRLWILPSDAVMSELSDLKHVDKTYEKMQAWSIAFFNGTFWDYIRYEHDIKMLSETEYHLSKRDELLKTGIQVSAPDFADPFDFRKVSIKKVVDPKNSIA